MAKPGEVLAFPASALLMPGDNGFGKALMPGGAGRAWRGGTPSLEAVVDTLGLANGMRVAKV